METKNPQAKVEELIEKINDFRSNVLEKNKGEAAAIEIDIVLGYLRELYEQVLLLRKNPVEKTHTASKPKEEPAEEKKPIIITKQEQPQLPQEEKKEAPPAQPVPPKKEIETEIPKVIAQKEEQQKKTSSSVKAEMLNRTPPRPSLNEKFKNNTSELGEQLGLKPVGDLKTAIGVNQRFAFINELFARNEQGHRQECINEAAITTRNK